MISSVDPVLADLAAAIDAIDATAVPTERLSTALIEVRRQAARLEAVAAALTARAERERVWAADGAVSMVEWLAQQTNTSKGDAKRSLELGRALDTVPELASLVDAGELSPDNARLVGRVGGQTEFAADKDLLLDIARTSSPTETKEALDTWQAMNRSGETADQRHARLYARRSLTFTDTDDGMVDMRGLLLPSDAAKVKRSLRHLAGAAWDDQSQRTDSQRQADALVDLCDAYSKGEVTGGRERPTLMGVVPFDTILGASDQPGYLPSEGLTISSVEVRRLACDAELHRLITAGASIVLDMGRTVRCATAAQYLALAARDGGCRWPGCDRPPDWCDAHHIDEHERDDGPTDLHNLVLLCSTHHTLIHHADWLLIGDAHTLVIRRPDGTLLPAPPRGPMHCIEQARQLALV